ncbi:hypothetical protein [Bartonella massiliensis]|uniref:hypothetical protein n=1 Tax=Bartonella massiliensis TaxID=929795 RepID=UPI00163BB0B9|nr:hypothetical protein [Bartonella massiliensis]
MTPLALRLLILISIYTHLLRHICKDQIEGNIGTILGLKGMKGKRDATIKFLMTLII